MSPFLGPQTSTLGKAKTQLRLLIGHPKQTLLTQQLATSSNNPEDFRQATSAGGVPLDVLPRGAWQVTSNQWLQLSHCSARIEASASTAPGSARRARPQLRRKWLGPMRRTREPGSRATKPVHLADVQRRRGRRRRRRPLLTSSLQQTIVMYSVSMKNPYMWHENRHTSIHQRILAR